jgi:hypothetical protein
VVFIPFAFVEAAANILTNPALDPFGKIPEFKFCAAKVEPAGPRQQAAEWGASFASITKKDGLSRGPAEARAAHAFALEFDDLPGGRRFQAGEGRLALFEFAR